MKTAAQIASHPKARLHREIVSNLRAFGSIEGAERGWLRFQCNPRLWKQIVTYGLGLPERQAKLNKIAFPDSNLAEVNAALKAGNNLNRLYELALGHTSVATDSAGRYKMGSKGLKIGRRSTPIHE
ncbi:MAG: hypothetical protein QOK24_951 [Verrucomicrobiota bacterium]|jgi:hypothetical protein